MDAEAARSGGCGGGRGSGPCSEARAPAPLRGEAGLRARAARRLRGARRDAVALFGAPERGATGALAARELAGGCRPGLLCRVLSAGLGARVEVAGRGSRASRWELVRVRGCGRVGSGPVATVDRDSTRTSCSPRPWEASWTSGSSPRRSERDGRARRRALLEPALDRRRARPCEPCRASHARGPAAAPAGSGP